MRRGDIWLADFEPSVGSEASKVRPAIIVSNDGSNARAARLARGIVTLVPLTTATQNVYPFQVLLPAAETNLPHDSKAQAEQVRSLDTSRLVRRLGAVPRELMAAVDDALRLHLQL